VRRSITRTAALALSVTLALGAAAVPSAAADSAATKPDGHLTRLSPASRQVLAQAASTATSKRDGLASPKLRRSEGRQAATPADPGSFFGTTRGKVTLVLMGAGVGLTLWSIHDSRKPVKSPVR
jgi:hypothetical protein